MAKILLIDDSADIRVLVRLLLRHAGHSVVEADNGEDGLRLAREEGPDLVFTDLAMPGLSGWDVVRLLKADPATAHLPILALTAHAMKGDREKAMALGCDGFIAKPIDEDVLERTLRAHLPPGAAVDPPPPAPPSARPSLPAPPAAEGDGRRRRVLVVDDNPGVMDLLRQYLVSAGFEVVGALDGPEAVEAVEREKPELVVLDVMLPGLDGYQVARAIKSRDGAAYLPVVLITAGPLDRERGLDAGADDFLGKPVDRSELLVRVRSLLRLSDSVEEARRAAEELRSLDKTKQRFIATIAHDLRTPLNAMGLTVELIRMQCTPPEEVTEGLDVLKQNIRQMNDLLAALLDYSSLVGGAIRLNPAPFDPRALVADVRASLAATATHKGLELREKLDDGLPAEVVSDYARCRQVLFNLASNALKFTSQGHVELRARADGDKRWAAEVGDTGVGIDPAEQQLIFEEFGQARRGRPADAPGTGLGLTISRHLARRLGGQLTVESRPGQGSTFTATWPVSLSVDDPGAPRE